MISQIHNSAGYLCLVSDKSWKVCQEQSNGVIAISLNNRVYDSELVTIKIRYFNYMLRETPRISRTPYSPYKVQFFSSSSDLMKSTVVD